MKKTVFLNLFNIAVIAVVISLLLNVSELLAQRGGKNFERGANFTQLKERLELSDEQIEKIKPILEEQRKQIQELREKMREKMRNDMQPFRDEVDRIHTENNKKLESILSSKQMEELKKIQQENREKSGERMKGSRKGKNSKP